MSFKTLQKNLEYQKQKILIHGDNHGMWLFSSNRKNGFRCSTAVGYLNPVKNRKNLKIITKAHVKKINFENKKAKSVNYWQDNELKTV